MALVLASRALADLEASRPGAHRTADLPLFSPSVACAVAFIAIPALYVHSSSSSRTKMEFSHENDKKLF